MATTMGTLALTPEVLVLIAERFKALAEPARLRILSCLGGGELTVSELVGETELGQANVSKHLQLLHAMGFVTRRRDGLFVHYSLADRRHEAKGRRRMGPRDITVHGECEPAVGLLRTQVRLHGPMAGSSPCP